MKKFIWFEKDQSYITQKYGLDNNFNFPVTLPVIATVPSFMISVACSVMLKLEGPSLECSEVFSMMLTPEVLSLMCPVVWVKLICEVVCSVDSLVLEMIELEALSVGCFGIYCCFTNIWILSSTYFIQFVKLILNT